MESFFYDYFVSFFLVFVNTFENLFYHAVHRLCTAEDYLHDEHTIRMSSVRPVAIRQHRANSADQFRIAKSEVYRLYRNVLYSKKELNFVIRADRLPLK